MARIDGGSCRIYDGVQDSRVLWDAGYKTDHKLEFSMVEMRQEVAGLRRSINESKFAEHRTGRDFPRRPTGGVDEDHLCRRLEERRAESFDVKGIDSTQHHIYRERYKSKVCRDGLFQGDDCIRVSDQSYRYGFDFYNFKANFPSFRGTLDTNHVLDWIDYVDDHFDETNPPEILKYQLAASKLRGQADTWWKELQNHRLSEGKDLISSWLEMSELLFNRFSPSNCSIKCPFLSYSSSQAKNNTKNTGNNNENSSPGEGSVEEQSKEIFGVKPANCSMKVLCEPHIRKQEAESDSEIIGASMNVKLSSGVDILEKATSHNSAIDETIGHFQAESMPHGFKLLDFVAKCENGERAEQTLALKCESSYPSSTIDDHDFQTNEQVDSTLRKGRESSEIDLESSVLMQEGYGIPEVRNSLQAAREFDMVVLDQLKNGGSEVLKIGVGQNLGVKADLDLIIRSENEVILDQQLKEKHHLMNEVLGATKSICKVQKWQLQEGAYQQFSELGHKLDESEQIIGAMLLVYLFHVNILNLLFEYIIILAGMLSFMFDPGGNYRRSEPILLMVSTGEQRSWSVSDGFIFNQLKMLSVFGSSIVDHLDDSRHSSENGLTSMGVWITPPFTILSPKSTCRKHSSIRRQSFTLWILYKAHANVNVYAIVSFDPGGINDSAKAWNSVNHFCMLFVIINCGWVGEYIKELEYGPRLDLDICCEVIKNNEEESLKKWSA